MTGSARVIQVIESDLQVKGAGKPDDPVRRPTQYFGLDGDLLAERDEWRDHQQRDAAQNAIIQQKLYNGWQVTIPDSGQFVLVAYGRNQIEIAAHYPDTGDRPAEWRSAHGYVLRSVTLWHPLPERMQGGAFDFPSPPDDNKLRAERAEIEWITAEAKRKLAKDARQLKRMRPFSKRKTKGRKKKGA